LEGRVQRVLIAGCGDVGTVLGRLMAARGDLVWGLRRHPDRLPPEIRPLQADLSDPATLTALPSALDLVVLTTAADATTDEAYLAAYVGGPLHLLAALARSGARPSRLLFVSSTSVYAQNQGEWVDESSPAEPAHFTGRRLREGERLVLAGPIPA